MPAAAGVANSVMNAAAARDAMGKAGWSASNLVGAGIAAAAGLDSWHRPIMLPATTCCSSSTHITLTSVLNCLVTVLELRIQATPRTGAGSATGTPRSGAGGICRRRSYSWQRRAAHSAAAVPMGSAAEPSGTSAAEAGESAGDRQLQTPWRRQQGRCRHRLYCNKHSSVM